MVTTVQVCGTADIERLRRAGLPEAELRRHEDRWRMQERGEGTYVLAWRGEQVVGRVTLLHRSKYDDVTIRLGATPEMNALAADPQGYGTGTAIIEYVEGIAARNGSSIVGLAVTVDNGGARRLYERLGYVEWSHGRVIDRWSELDEHGTVVRDHADECFYLVKRLEIATASRAQPLRNDGHAVEKVVE